MGIYLPNMEMPSLGYREIRIYPDGRVIEEVERGWEEFVGTAVHVPPHGRLIDADDTENITVVMNENGSGFNRIIAPTIIPAEETEK